jgi:hypothetical protein
MNKALSQFMALLKGAGKRFMKNENVRRRGAWFRMGIMVSSLGIGCGHERIVERDHSPFSWMYPAVPHEFRQSGMISSSTYQVLVAVEADRREDALELGQELARQKALNLMMQEVFISRKISMDGRKKIHDLIYENGRIVRIDRENENRYNLVFQVNRPGLWSYVAGIR